MVKRTCPECGAANYSANAEAEYWKCHQCGTKISIELQVDAGRFGNFEGGGE